MTALADANIKEVDKFIREALEAALEAQVNAFREQTLGRSDLKRGLR